MPMVDLREKRVWGLNDPINFGKYKGEGKKVKDLLKEAPDYLLWCDDNIEWFNLDEDVRLQAEDQAEKKREERLLGRRRGGSRMTDLRPRVFDDADDGDDDGDPPF